LRKAIKDSLFSQLENNHILSDKKI